MKKKSITVILLVILAIVVALAPLFIIRDTEFEGSDTKGSDMVNEVTGGKYEPWFSPVLEYFIGGELPGEMETLFFSIQTGIGVGVIAFGFGYLAARKKYSRDYATQ